MKKLIYLIVLTLILGLVLTGCFLSNLGQVPTTEQSGIAYLTRDPSPSGLVGLWHFDEGTGAKAQDSSVNNNEGDLHGASWEVDGKFGNALSFDGDGDYVQLPASNTILNTNTFTIEAWFKTSVNHPAYGVGDMEGRLINLHWKNTASTAVSLYVEKDKIGLLYNTDDMDHVWVKYTVNYHDNFWHHIAVTYDATTYRLYYDGEEVVSQADAFGGFGAYPAYLGTYNGSQRFFNGLIDEVRIWDTALTADQLIIYDKFNGLLAPYKEPPKAFKVGSSIPLKWHYTDLAGEVVDSSAASHSVEIKQAYGSSGLDTGDPAILVNDPGQSGLRYDSSTYMWIYNWQTKEELPGFYNIRIINDWTGQTFGPFLILLR